MKLSGQRHHCIPNLMQFKLLKPYELFNDMQHKFKNSLLHYHQVYELQLTRS
ncbi:MAG: hypothetical protein M1837_002372 [Sclerophora amabilis]|nr:MAG: hypothetical protein M1837_002372 [Sclerophora amabilis]